MSVEIINHPYREAASLHTSPSNTMIVGVTISFLFALLYVFDQMPCAKASWVSDSTLGISWLDTTIREFLELSATASSTIVASTSSTLFPTKSNKQKERPNATTHPCQREEHLDHQECKLEELDEAALKSICDRLGINVHDDVFAYTLPSTNHAEHHDYVRAAYECLMTEKEVQELLVAHKIPDDLVDPDVQLVADMLLEILEKEPQLLREFEGSMREQDSDLWKSLRATFDDNDEILPTLLADTLLAYSA